MNKKTITSLAFMLAAGFLMPALASGIDKEAAMSLARNNDCFKCHAEEKAKLGPSFKQVSLNLKGNPDAEAILVKHLTTGPMVKMQGGMEMKHKIVDTQDQNEIINLVNWILSH